MKILITWGEVDGQGSANNQRKEIIGWCKEIGAEVITPQEPNDGPSLSGGSDLYLHVVCGCCPHSTNMSNLRQIGYGSTGPTLLFVTTDSSGAETKYAPWIIRVKNKAHLLDLIVEYGK